MEHAVIFILLPACAVACYTDLRYRIIPNKLTFPLILAAPALWGGLAGWPGVLASFVGILLGLLLLIIPYALGGMGEGDVKLLMAIGGLGGPAFVFSVFIYMCIAGGVAALVMLAQKRMLVSTMENMLFSVWWLTASGKMPPALASTKLTMPYALPITAGVVASLAYPLAFNI